jgi:tripartite ATP-independent transporter DctM subunit
MSEVPHAEHLPRIATAGPTLPGRAVASLARVLAVVAALGILAMALATAYDVSARYFFNSPTTWATEISTYLLIASVFFGAGYTHLSGGNVRIKMVLDRLAPSAARDLELLTAWLALVYVGVAGWQAILLVLSDYQHGSRIFSLLLTPSWMPKTPIAIGLCVLAAAIIAEIDRLSSDRAQSRRMIPYALLALVTALLLAFGRAPPFVPGTRLDFGSVAILLAVLAGAFLTNGVRVGGGVLAIAAVSIALFIAGKPLGAGFLTTLLFIAIAFYLAIGVRVAFALALVGMLSIYLMTPVPFPVTLPDRAWSGLNSFSLTAVPLKVLMATILVHSGMTSELFTMMARLLRPFPGGLAHAATLGCATFAAVSGSSVATAATIGTVAIPEMTRRGYSDRLTYGTIAAGGTLGILVPPSIAMIIYATNVGVPATKLFIAGILPAALMTALFMGVVLVWALLYPGAAPSVPKGVVVPQSRNGTIDSILVVLLVGIVVVSLYAGIATATETGAVGVIAAFVICGARGRLTWRNVVECLTGSVIVTSFIFLIVVGANVISFGFDYLKISQKIMATATDTRISAWLVFATVVLVYVVLGAFLDSISMLVLTLPVVFPVIQGLGFDPLWFGVVLMILAEVGLIHPPMGMNLFVLQGIGRTVTMRTITLGALPFLAAMFLTVFVLYLFPDIALFLTRHIE